METVELKKASMLNKYKADAKKGVLFGSDML